MKKDGDILNIEYKNTNDLIPYKNNPRNNDHAIQYVAKSIEEFGFKVPIIIDQDNVIVCGHTRHKAALELGMKNVPCIVADDLTEQQVRAFRLADNKIGEMSKWNYDLLLNELEEFPEELVKDLGFHIMDDLDIDDFFNDSESKEKAPKIIKCPCCGKTFEKVK